MEHNNGNFKVANEHLSLPISSKTFKGIKKRTIIKTPDAKHQVQVVFISSFLLRGAFLHRRLQISRCQELQ
jgi:hypothetical protein